MAISEDEIQPVGPSTTGEDVRLEHLGYEQELKRSFGLLGMIGFSFSVVTSGVFIVGVTSGGPPVMVFSFIGVSLLTLAVAIPMAEMCSMYPVAGGQYSWVAALAPPKISRQLSYITGWFMLIGLLAMGATNNSIAAQFVLGMANLVFPSYEIQRWQTVLVAYLVAILAAAINIWGPHLLNRIARFILIWNITAFFITVIVLLATNDHKQSASFVFVEFQNFTGWDRAMAAIVGILQACFASMIAVIVIVAGNNILAEGSRCVYAFARDNGLPFSRFLAKVDKKRQVPINAVLLTLIVQLALDAIDFGTSTGFETVIAISTEGFYLSYAMALGSRLLGYVTNHRRTLTGPFALPTSMSISLNVLGLLFLLFASITFNFPESYPVTKDSMNYTSAAIGVIGVISVATWVVTGRKHFTGPGVWDGSGSRVTEGKVVELNEEKDEVEMEKRG
ncbi:GABA permease [Aspergillus luchuensis]|uniref:GABA permease n=1 Tax=Aspergillus kawachii TaxID=1069201 RepID=A0A146FYK2_ASPKA|nr:GABA permease [Aspergillus luchuensis]